MELQLGAELFSVASLSPDTIVINDPKPHVPAASGIVRVIVDGHVTTYHIELPEGVDPARRRQICRIVQPVGVSAVA